MSNSTTVGMLRVVIAHRPPFVTTQNISLGPNGVPNYWGMLIDLLPLLLKKANISADFEYYVAPANSGGQIVTELTTGISLPTVLCAVLEGTFLHTPKATPATPAHTSIHHAPHSTHACATLLIRMRHTPHTHAPHSAYACTALRMPCATLLHAPHSACHAPHSANACPTILVCMHHNPHALLQAGCGA